jgi:hypothetical protein
MKHIYLGEIQPAVTAPLLQHDHAHHHDHDDAPVLYHCCRVSLTAGGSYHMLSSAEIYTFNASYAFVG